MTVTTSNLIMGPGTLYKGAFGATEPADSAVNAAPAASAWTDVGGTLGGVALTVAQEYKELEVDQLIDVPGRRRTKREVMIKTALAEATLENLAIALNGGTVTDNGTNATYDPEGSDAGVEPTYGALIFDGYSPGGLRRRVIGRKMLNVESVETNAKKDDQTVFAVSFASHYVNSSTKPYRVIDQQAA